MENGEVHCAPVVGWVLGAGARLLPCGQQQDGSWQLAVWPLDLCSRRHLMAAATRLGASGWRRAVGGASGWRRAAGGASGGPGALARASTLARRQAVALAGLWARLAGRDCRVDRGGGRACV